MFTDSDETPANVTLDRPERNPGSFGNVVMCQVLDVGEFDDLPRSGWKRRHRVDDEHAIDYPFDLWLCLWLVGRRVGEVVGSPVDVTSLSSEVVDDPPLGDPD